jgi:hypothetical protein
MLRPLLEIWREQNRDRDCEPSSLLKQSAPGPNMEWLREFGETMRRIQQSPFGEEMRRIQQSLREFAETHEMRLVVAERPMGRMRPVAPVPDKPKRKRKPGGGNKPALKGKEIEYWKETYRSMLNENPKWTKSQEASAKRLIEVLGNRVSWWTVKRWIVAPVLKERQAK